MTSGLRAVGRRRPRSATRGCRAGRGPRRGYGPRPTRPARGRRSRPRPSDRLRLARVDLVDLGLDLLEKFPVARHGFKNDSSAVRAFPWPSRGPATLEPHVAAPRASSLIVAVAGASSRPASVVGVTLATRQTPQQPKAQPGKPPLGRDLPTPAAAQIRAAFKDWPHGQHRRRWSGSAASTRSDPVVQLYRGIALLWAGLPERRAGRARAAKKLGRDTIMRGAGRQPAPPASSSPRSELPDLPADRGRTALLEQGSRLQAAGAPASRRERVYQRAARQQPERRRGAGRRRGRRSSTRTT